VIRLAVRARADEAEVVLAALLELAPSGVEQVDLDGEVEFAVYGARGARPARAGGEADVAGVRVVVSGTVVEDDWGERWKQFHRPVLVGGRIYVRPPWERPLKRREPATKQAVSERDRDVPFGDGILDLMIDPGRAFGTGSHPTTRLCLELLLDVTDGGSVVDLGCGSGVLSIAAAKLGFGPITALDADRLATEATETNATANGVRLGRVACANLREQPAPQAGLVLANLMRPLLLQVANLMGNRRPTHLIVSGLLDEEADEVAAAFAPMTERRRLADKGWSALLLQA
jgi:ribosomal protein L11 methyltransferase